MIKFFWSKGRNIQSNKLLAISKGKSMNFKKSLWKVLTFMAVMFFLFRPEYMALGLFIDAIGLDIFLLLLEVQFIAVSGYYVQNWVKPIFKPIYLSIKKVDPYFFIPTKKVVTKIPSILLHAVPGFMFLYLDCLFIIPDSATA